MKIKMKMNLFSIQPEDYGNITVIRVASYKIWIPDLLLYNSADDSFDPKSQVNALIYSNGEVFTFFSYFKFNFKLSQYLQVSYLPPGMFKSTCTIEIFEFPFDDQMCFLKFGRYDFNKNKVYPQETKLDAKNLVKF